MTGHIHPCIMFSGFLSIALVIAIIVVIYIHGNQLTVGCIPLTDDKIKEVYVLAVEASNSGQKQIPVHIFPFKMTKENMNKKTAVFPQHKVFWKTLQLAYDNFKKSKTTV